MGASCDLPSHSVWDPKILAGAQGSRSLVLIAARKGRCNQVGWVSSGSGWGAEAGEARWDSTLAPTGPPCICTQPIPALLSRCLEREFFPHSFSGGSGEATCALVKNKGRSCAPEPTAPPAKPGYQCHFPRMPGDFGAHMLHLRYHLLGNKQSGTAGGSGEHSSSWEG